MRTAMRLGGETKEKGKAGAALAGLWAVQGIPGLWVFDNNLNAAAIDAFAETPDHLLAGYTSGKASGVATFQRAKAIELAVCAAIGVSGVPAAEGLELKVAVVPEPKAPKAPKEPKPPKAEKPPKAPKEPKPPKAPKEPKTKPAAVVDEVAEAEVAAAEAVVS